MKFIIVPSYDVIGSELKPLLSFLKEKGFKDSRITTARLGSYISITERVGYRYPGEAGQDIVKLLRILVKDYNKMIGTSK